MQLFLGEGAKLGGKQQPRHNPMESHGEKRLPRQAMRTLPSWGTVGTIYLQDRGGGTKPDPSPPSPPASLKPVPDLPLSQS